MHDKLIKKKKKYLKSNHRSHSVILYKCISEAVLDME